MSQDQTTPELGLIARQQRQILNEIGTMRDDTAIMMAMMQRLDGTVVGLVNEVRATHSQHNRLVNRINALEERTP